MMFDIELPEKVSANKFYGGMHWSRRAKLAETYHWAVKAATMGIKKRDWPYPVKIDFEFMFKSSPLDASNCAIMAKMIEDGLVQCGHLADDDYKHVAEIKISVSPHKWGRPTARVVIHTD